MKTIRDELDEMADSLHALGKRMNEQDKIISEQRSDIKLMNNALNCTSAMADVLADKVGTLASDQIPNERSDEGAIRRQHERRCVINRKLTAMPDSDDSVDYIDFRDGVDFVASVMGSDLSGLFGPEVVNKIKAADAPVEVELSMRIVGQPENGL